MPRPSGKRYGRPRPQSRPAGPWKHGAIPVIGLIGGIGGGKSRVAALLADRGAFVIDADAVGHALLDQRPVRELDRRAVRHRRSSSRSGPPMTPGGRPRIDRRSLGAIVFAEPSALRQLESILHPRMRRTFERAIARTVRRESRPRVVLDAAILLEAGWNTLCDQVVFVDAPRDRTPGPPRPPRAAGAKRRSPHARRPSGRWSASEARPTSSSQRRRLEPRGARRGDPPPRHAIAPPGARLPGPPALGRPAPWPAVGLPTRRGDVESHFPPGGSCSLVHDLSSCSRWINRLT